MRLMTSCAMLLALCAGAASAADAPTLKSISEAFFAETAKASPSWATAQGWHQYDSRPDDVTPAAHSAAIKREKDALAAVAALDDAKLTPMERDDKAIFTAWLNGQLLEDETIQMWRRNPDQYVGLALASVNALISRDFASQDERIKRVIARESAIPKMLKDALLRDCRRVDRVKMHVQGMSLDEAVKTMKEACAVPESGAFKEARRGVSDPGYFSDTVGKLEIMKLREDVKAKEGDKFSLQSFHDRFSGAGLIPINVIRREMLGQDGPSL